MFDYLLQAEYVIVVVYLFVCLLAICAKTSERICMKFSGKVGNGPMNKWLNFGGDLVTDPDTDRITRHW